MDFNNIHFLAAGKKNANKSWKLPEHQHSFNELIVVYKGQLHVNIMGKTLLAGTGDILFYPESVPHEEKSSATDPDECIFLAWQGDIGDRRLINHDSQGRIRTMTMWLYEDDTNEGVNREIIQTTLFDSIVAEYIRLCDSVQLNDMIKDARTYMRDNVTKKITIDQLARKAHLSKYYFIRKYKQLTKTTPIEDLNKIRLEKACELLITTNLPIKYIAELSGFANEYYMSRMFRNKLHTTPGYYRKITNHSV